MHSTGQTLTWCSGLSLYDFDTKDICMPDHKLVLFCLVLSPVIQNTIYNQAFYFMSVNKLSDLLNYAPLTA